MFPGKGWFGKACVLQLGVLLAWFLPWYYLRTVAFLANPPYGDLYAQTWSYQLVMGTLWLAGLIAALTVVLILEASLLKLYRVARMRWRSSERA
jgi:hypothetical protein